MPAGIRFPTVGLPDSAEELRAEVRESLSCEITAGAFSPPEERDRHAGLSQRTLDFSTPGMTVTPIQLLTGEHVFNEVMMEDVQVPDGMVLGNIGDGWRQVTSELAFERTGAFPQHVPALRGAGPRARPRPRREGEGRGRRPGGAAVDAAPDVSLGGWRAGGGG
ncbi:MAG TPA: hypothetical protein VE194_12270, partial [Rubrobacter sp.]|nr:hypothetical protein [Rubrobacter sp.]